MNKLLPFNKIFGRIIDEAAHLYVRLSPSLQNLIKHKTDGADDIGAHETVIVVLSGKPLKTSWLSRLWSRARIRT